MPVDDPIDRFRVIASYLYPETVVSALCIIEHIVCRHESATGKPV
jgi:hypothetical protein